MAGRLLYVPASALPYHISGYTTRTQAVIRALTAAGADVQVLTRPGYPWDRGDRTQDPAATETVVDGIVYNHARHPSNRRPLLQFAAQAARVIEEFARDRRVAFIHAASNHTNALPALVAARRLGIPFHYEMRGLWELTRASRMPAFVKSPGFRHGLSLEGFVARHADRVFVISEQLGRLVQTRWHVPAERVILLPNCVDPERFIPAATGQIESNTLAYAGSLISYEGLDTLVDAVGILAGRGVEVRVNIVGDGEARAQLEAQVGDRGLSGHIRFFGKLPPEAAHEILGRCALVCIPRKPFEVCEIVPPIKLVEALAMAKPVIVPDLPVFRDELGDHPAGWFFAAGNAVDLARVIEAALTDRAALLATGMRAREYATMRRRWRDFVPGIIRSGSHGMAD